MSNLELQVAALMKLVTAEDEASREEAKAEILSLMQESTVAEPGAMDLETEIRAMLLKMGVPDSVRGHRYLVDALRLTAEKPELIDNMTKKGGLYYTVAENMDTTGSRVERAIRHAIECAWDRGDWDVFESYFGNTISIGKGKPTNSEFIARLTNEIVLRRKAVA